MQKNVQMENPQTRRYVVGSQLFHMFMLIFQDVKSVKASVKVIVHLSKQI